VQAGTFAGRQGRQKRFLLGQALQLHVAIPPRDGLSGEYVTGPAERSGPGGLFSMDERD
jgi:hypothetical protein